MSPLFYFQYDFRSSESITDLLTVVLDRIARAFNRPGAIRAVTLDMSKAYWISGQIFGLFFSFLSNRWLQVAPDWNASQEYTVNAGVPPGTITCPDLSYYTLMTLLMMLSVILLSMLMILLSTLSVIRHLICCNS